MRVRSSSPSARALRAFAFLALAGLPLAPVLAKQPEAGAVLPGPAFKVMRLGADKVVALSDGMTALPVDKLLIDDHPGAVQSLLDAAHRQSPIDTSVNAYLIDTGTRRVLVDTGSGVLLGPTLGKVLESLKAAGYSPEQIDTIVITHLHPDHIGGAAVDGHAVFPNATIRVAEAEAAFWLDKANLPKVDASVSGAFDGAALSLAPYQAAGRVKTFAPNESVAPGLVAVTEVGHTAGHTAFRLESKGQVMMFVGDVVHVQAVQFTDPAIAIHFDTTPDQAVPTRVSLFNDAATHHYWVAGSHLAFPGVGHVEKQGDHFTWAPGIPAAK